MRYTWSPENETIQHAGLVTGIDGVANHVYRNSPRNNSGYLGQLCLTRNVSCVTVACLVMRRVVLDEVGGFGESELTEGFNDVDLCLRIREHGYLIVWTPFAESYRVGSASQGSDTVPEHAERFNREVRYMRERWGVALSSDPYYNPNP